MTQRIAEDMALALALEGQTIARGKTAELVALADVLSQLPDPEIDTRFAAALEARLLSEGFAEQHAPTLHVVRAIPDSPAEDIVRRADVIQMPRRRMVVRRGMVAGVVAASMAAFPLIAAASALPGSPFYGLRRTMERVELAFAGSAVDRGMDYAKFGAERAQELSALVLQHADKDLIDATAAEMRSELEKAQDLVIGHTTDRGILTRFAGIVSGIQTQMKAITGTMTSDARADLNGAMQTSREIQAAVADALNLKVPTIETAAPVASVDAPVATDSGSQSVNDQGGSDSQGSGSQGKDSTVKDTRHAADEDPTGTGKGVGDASDKGCEVPGSANGLGDITAPVVRVLCN